MNDREMLELAAKAAGVRLFVYGAPGYEGYQDQDAQKPWNPLTDYGDALRLAVKLGMCVTIFKHSEPPATMVGYLRKTGDGANIEYAHADSDELTATRLAIVFAASDMGANM